MKINEISSLIILLTTVWVYLLFLCLSIGFLLVPLNSNNSELMNFFIASFKVFASIILIIVWLFSWYKAMQFILTIEMNEEFKNSKDTQSSS